MSDRTSILIIYTGGTIGMREDPKTKTLSPMKFDLIKDEIPELHKLGYNLDSITFNPPIDSSNMTPDIWIEIAETIKRNYLTYDGFVILHGTDTMAYTASALSYMLENLDKPIILTGSQLPIGILRTDGKENLITAIQIAAAKRNGKAIVPEVCIYFSSKLFRGNRTTKEDSQQFNAFTSHHYPPLATAGVDILYNVEKIHYPAEQEKLNVNTLLDDNVFVVRLFPGLNSHYFQSVINLPHVKGIVLESFGSGNMPTFSWFLNSIRIASDTGKIFMNVSQCPGGKVQMGFYETSAALIDAGVVSGQEITSEAAVTKLMFLLGQNLPIEQVKDCLKLNLRGEMDQ